MRLKKTHTSDSEPTTPLEIKNNDSWISGVTWDLQENKIVKESPKKEPKVESKVEPKSEPETVSEASAAPEPQPVAEPQPKPEPEKIKKPAKQKRLPAGDKGIEGMVIHDGGKIPAGVKIDAVRVSDGVVLSTAKVKSDGYYVIKNLTPGKYKLKLTGVKNPPKSVDVEISKTDDWVTGIPIEWVK